MINNLITKFIAKILNRRAYRNRKKYLLNKTFSQYKEFDFNKVIKGEDRYKRKWSGISYNNISPVFYRLYSTISGFRSLNYLPEDVYAIYILRLLNNSSKHGAYSDKNFYDIISQKSCFPKSFIRCIDNCVYNETYNPINDINSRIELLSNREDKLIIKPSLSAGGENVFCFKVDSKNRFINSNGDILNSNFITNHFKDNYVIQEYVEQSDFHSKFNPSSLNSIRIYTYRSVSDDNIRILASVFRVGRKGAIVDNMCQGGFGIAVDSDGSLSDYGIDKHANKVNSLNGIALCNNIEIPGFDEYKRCAKKIAKLFIYDRFLGLDLVKNSDDEVRIIEVNNGYVGVGLPQLVGLPVFGEYTDEIINYCKKHKNLVNNSYTLKL